MNRQHYIVFGAGDKHDKAVIIAKSPKLNGYELNIVALADGEKYSAGQEIQIADITGLYTTLYFTRLNSLKAFAEAINKTVEKWENEENE